MSKYENQILESMDHQLTLVWLLEAPWITPPQRHWQNRIRHFIQWSLDQLLPHYLSSCSNTPQADEHTVPWLLQHPRLGIEAFIAVCAECTKGQVIATDALQTKLDKIEFDIYANRHKKYWIELGPYVVSLQAGEDPNLILTIDVYRLGDGHLDGFSVYSDTEEIPAVLKRKFPGASADDLRYLTQGALLLAAKPEEWTSFFGYALLYSSPPAETLEKLGFSVDNDEDE